MPKRGGVGWTRYQPLVDHLAVSDETEVILTLTEIEAILGAPLPDSAYVNLDSWMELRHAYVRRWRALGWRAHLDRRNQCVIFTRFTEE